MILVDWFLPGYKAGGPIRSVANLAATLKEHHEVRILTGDRDFTDSEPYLSVNADEWTEAPDGTMTWYCSEARLGKKTFEAILNDFDPDIIYFNSMFSRSFTLSPLRWGKGREMILAPRGMLHPGALSIKTTKKRTFLKLFKTLGLHKRLRFHATDDAEAEHIKGIFGHQVKIHVAPNLPSPVPEKVEFRHKHMGKARFVFVSRVSPKKNLDLLLHAVGGITGEIELEIIGTEEDENYLKECKSIAGELPPGIKVKWTGPIPQSKLEEVWQRSDFFVLPTRGENFGHAIFEALAHGVPVILSDQTPWRGLTDKRVGWDVSLNKSIEYVEALQTAVDMGDDVFGEWQVEAHRFAARYVVESGVIEKSLNLFSDGGH